MITSSVCRFLFHIDWSHKTFHRTESIGGGNVVFRVVSCRSLPVLDSITTWSLSALQLNCASHSECETNCWKCWEGKTSPPNRAGKTSPNGAALYSLKFIFTFSSWQESVVCMTLGLLDVLWRTTSSKHGDITLFRKSKSWRLTAPCSRLSQC